MQHTIQLTDSGNGFIIDRKTSRPRGRYYEIVSYNDKVGIKDLVSRNFIVSPIPFADWNGGSFSSVDDAIQKLDVFLFTEATSGGSSSGGGGGNDNSSYTDNIGDPRTVTNLINGTPQVISIANIKDATIWNRTNGKVFIEMPNGEGARFDPNDERCFTKDLGLYNGDITITPLEDGVNTQIPGDISDPVIEFQLNKYLNI